MRQVAPERRDEVSEQLALPFGMHPELTLAAKRRRAEMTKQMMQGR